MNEQLALSLPTLAKIPEEAVAIVAVGGGLVVAVVWIVLATIDSMVKSRERERSRREIAAYVAEGSMSAEEGERLMKAGAEAEDE
ncbi:MAG: hypothetical protein KJZ54_12015 [Phycisphaerales bacterium]|nr:hypothetical protein [Phycisphaerales bacterium]